MKKPCKFQDQCININCGFTHENEEQRYPFLGSKNHMYPQRSRQAFQTNQGQWVRNSPRGNL